MDEARKQILFAGRTKNPDGTYGLTNSLPIEKLIEAIMDLLPIDLIYLVDCGENGKIDLKEVGYLGLTYKPIPEGTSGDTDDKEAKQNNEPKLRQESEQVRQGSSDRLRESRMVEERNNEYDQGRTQNQREEGQAEQASRFQARQDGRGSLKTQPAPIRVPFGEGEAEQVPMFNEETHEQIKQKQKLERATKGQFSNGHAAKKKGRPPKAPTKKRDILSSFTWRGNKQ